MEACIKEKHLLPSPLILTIFNHLQDKLMKTRTTLSTISFLMLLFLPSLGLAQNYLPLSNAKVVSVSEPGAIIERGGQQMAVEAGMIIEEGDILRSRSAKVSFVFKNGSTSTIFPGSEVEFETIRQARIPASVNKRYGELDYNPSESVTLLRLKSGEIRGHVKKLREVAPASRFEVATKVGVAGIRGTLYRIVLQRVGGLWSYTLTNIRGDVVFIPSMNLNADNVIAVVPPAGEAAPLDSGEEIIIEGTFDDDEEVFTIVTEGYTESSISDEALQEIEEDISELDSEAGDTIPADDAQTDAPQQPITSGPRPILIPVEDVEIASGSDTE